MDTHPKAHRRHRLTMGCAIALIAVGALSWMICLFILYVSPPLVFARTYGSAWTSMLLGSLVLCVAGGVLGVFERSRWKREQRTAGICQHCEYDRATLSPEQPCPECGKLRTSAMSDLAGQED